MEVICLHDEAFYALLNKVIDIVKEEIGHQENSWISTEAAMKKLGIKSKTTLQLLRDTGKIRFTQPHKKIILYDTRSIDDFLQENARELF